MLVTLALAAFAEPAPDRAWNGLVLGESDAATVVAWLADRGLACPAEPSPRRTTTHHRCRDGGGKLLLARLDDGPLHHTSTDVRIADPEEARARYESAVARLTERFGPPQRLGPLGATDGVNLRYTTAWAFDDLTVRVSLLRFNGGDLTVSERWDVPGAEARAEARPGTTNPHGGGAPAPRRNPHLNPED